MDTIDRLSTRYKAVWLTIRSVAVCCSCATLSLFIVALCLYLVRSGGDTVDTGGVFKYLQIAGAAFSLAWHLFEMILLGSGTFNRIPRWFHLSLEIGSGILLGIMGYLAFAQDRIDRKALDPWGLPKKYPYGEEGIKIAAVTILSITCITHLGFFVFGIVSKPTPVQPDVHRSQSCDGCISLQTLRKEPTAVTAHSVPDSDSRSASHAQLPQEVVAQRAATPSPPNGTTNPIPNEDAPAYTRGNYQVEELGMVSTQSQQRTLPLDPEEPIIIAAPTAEMMRMAPAVVQKRHENGRSAQRNSRLFSMDGSSHDFDFRSGEYQSEPVSPVSPNAESSGLPRRPAAAALEEEDSESSMRRSSISKQPSAS